MGVAYSLALPASEPVEADSLAPLLGPLSSLRGVGPAVAEKLERLTGGGRTRDLLFHLPDSFIDRRAKATLAASARRIEARWTENPSGVSTSSETRPEITSNPSGGRRWDRMLFGIGAALASAVVKAGPHPAAIAPVPGHRQAA